MPTKARFAPRRSPRQARAQATVDAILDAAAYILVRDGWEKLNTNRIAERAGVNIATLYQYFPNKEAIAVGLQHRHGDEVRKRLKAVLPEVGESRDLRSLLRALVQAGIDEHQVAPALHRALDEELPRSARRTSSQARPSAMIERWKAAAVPLFRNVPDHDVADFIARVSTHAVIHEAAIERPDLLASPTLVDELVTLLERYLKRPHRSATAKQAPR